MALDKKIVFFDGECGACNAFVRFLLKRDTAKQFTFAPLQGQTASRQFSESPDLSTMIYRDGNKVFFQSNAVLTSVAALGFPWSMLLALKIIPRPIRDFFYGVFAKLRYRFSSYFQSCALLTPDERSRFLP